LDAGLSQKSVVGAEKAKIVARKEKGLLILALRGVLWPQKKRGSYCRVFGAALAMASADAARKGSEHGLWQIVSIGLLCGGSWAEDPGEITTWD